MLSAAYLYSRNLIAPSPHRICRWYSEDTGHWSIMINHDKKNHDQILNQIQFSDLRFCEVNSRSLRRIHGHCAAYGINGYEIGWCWRSASTCPLRPITAHYDPAKKRSVDDRCRGLVSDGLSCRVDAIDDLCLHVGQQNVWNWRSWICWISHDIARILWEMRTFYDILLDTLE